MGHISPDYGVSRKPGRRSRDTDTDSAETFIKEFQDFEKNGKLPRFMVMSLGEDHTMGTRPGTFTPQACVASNDLALGRLVEYPFFYPTTPPERGRTRQPRHTQAEGASSKTRRPAPAWARRTCHAQMRPRRNGGSSLPNRPSNICCQRA